MSRMLGVDLGEERIGLAIADEGGRARPLTTVRRSESARGDAVLLDRLATEQRATEIIVGLPLELSGAEGPQATRTREWAIAVGKLLELHMGFRDERRTTVRAADRVGSVRRGRSGGPPTPAQRGAARARLDREAACLILQDEIDARAASFTDDAGPSRRPPGQGA